jgi:DNA polymerase I-like protein with 3'-5' exonuclease and polymerase domains
MLRRRGQFDFSGTATEYLASLPPAEIEELKIRFAIARQQSKAINFGLLYGMMPDTLHRYGVINVGLDWTIADANEAYAMWFELYPEIGFLHCFIKYLQSEKIAPDSVRIWNKFTQEFEVQAWPVKRFKPFSLVGRPFDILKHTNAALSYPGQGSGTDITTRAIANLPPELAACLALAIHDEIVLVVPEKEADAALVKLTTVMNEAGNYVLGDDCASAVDAKIHDCWSK